MIIEKMLHHVTFDISRIYSDGTGLIHAHKNQVLKLEYKPFIRHAFLTSINLIGDTFSEIYFSSIAYIYGKGVQIKGQTETSSLATSGRLAILVMYKTQIENYCRLVNL